LDYDPALTNREHLTRLTADGDTRRAFQQVTQQFELVWYGCQPVGSEELAAFRAACQRLVEAPA
jgi:hypothetical protein